MEFEWDETKRLANIAKHGIDFRIAISVFEGPCLLKASDRDGEERWLSIGYVRERLVAVAWTMRGTATRIISVRRARPDEREDFARHFGGSEVR